MYFKKTIIILLLLFGGFTSKAQYSNEELPRLNNEFRASYTIGGPTGIFSISVDYFLNETVNLEAGVGLFGVYAGANFYYYTLANNRWSLYAGIQPNIFLSTGASPKLHFYTPLGLAYHARNTPFQLKFEIAPHTGINHQLENNMPQNVWFAIKIGGDVEKVLQILSDIGESAICVSLN